MSARLGSRLLLAAPGLALAAGVVTVALESPNADRLLAALQAGVGVILVWGVAVAIRLRYPDRPLSLLLFFLAGVYAIQTLVTSPNPYLFTMARVARPVAEVILIWVMLAFPSGRLPGLPERALVLTAALAVALLWIPAVMVSPRIPLAGSFVTCAADCPRNVLHLFDQPELSRALHVVFRAVGTMALVATAILLFVRLRQATPLRRTALAPVLLASMARALSIAAFLLVDGFALGTVITFWAVPLAIGLGLLRGRLYIAKALERLVTGMRSRPDMATLRDVMADALSDPSLAIAYWLPERDHWVDANGDVVVLPYPTPVRGRAVTIVSDAESRPVAALIHDVALLETPTLVDAVTRTTAVALESHRIEAELRASQANAANAVADERHRIERDLHDGAQQRLIALRMKLSVTARLLDADPARAKALVSELGGDVEAAIAELRAFARGIVPPLLQERGLRDALADAAQIAVIPTRVRIEEVGRGKPATESAVYFCCLEALQNGAKHAGAAANADLTVWLDGKLLRFSVCDDGTGIDGSAGMRDGRGLSNMRARIEAVGGQVEIQTRDGGGVTVSGSVPWFQ